MGKVVAFLAVIVAGGALAFLYYELQTAPLSTEPSVYVTTVADRSVKVVHAFQDGIHRYSGSFRLPHSCYEVTKAAVRDPLDPDRVDVLLQFTTKDRSADFKPCAEYATTYPFELMVDTEEHAAVRAEIDGKQVSLRVTESTWLSPRGTVVTSPQGQ